MVTYQTIVKNLRSSGFRLTDTRKYLVELFCTVRKPVSAEDILKATDRKGKKIHKVTIYRELDFLENRGIIDSVDFGDRKKRFELALQRHHHHVVCCKCKRVEDVVLGRHLEKEMRHIQKIKQFKITSHTLEFFGLCANCQSQKQSHIV